MSLSGDVPQGGLRTWSQVSTPCQGVSLHGVLKCVLYRDTTDLFLVHACPRKIALYDLHASSLLARRQSKWADDFGDSWKSMARVALVRDVDSSRTVAAVKLDAAGLPDSVTA